MFILTQKNAFFNIIVNFYKTAKTGRNQPPKRAKTARNDCQYCIIAKISFFVLLKVTKSK